MRHYVLQRSRFGLPARIIAETFEPPELRRPGDEAGWYCRPGDTADGRFDDTDLEILSIDQVRTVPGGPAALAAWRAGDDSGSEADVRYGFAEALIFSDMGPQDVDAFVAKLTDDEHRQAWRAACRTAGLTDAEADKGFAAFKQATEFAQVESAAEVGRGTRRLHSVYASDPSTP